MKYLEKIDLKISSLADIYSERIQKLREKNSVKAEFKLRKIESMAKRGKNTSSAEMRLKKFLDNWESRESHHNQMKADRIAKLKEKKQSFIYKELKKKLLAYQRKRRRQDRQQEMRRRRNELIEAERGGWRGRRYRRERDRLIWNLHRRRQGIVGNVAHRGDAIDYYIHAIDGDVDVLDFLQSCRQETLRIMVPRHVPSKTQLKLDCIFTRNTEDGSEEEEKIISTKMIFVPYGSDFVSEWNYAVSDLLRKLHNFMREKSGWRIKEIVKLIISTNHYDPERGGTFIEIPKEMAAKKALINIKNTDNECFKWAITRSLFEPITFKNNPGKVSKELIENSKTLNWKDINFPAYRKDFHIFERNNPDIGLIVYTKENKEYVPVFLTKKEDCKKAYIFFYKDHYLTITSLSRLVNKNPTSKHKKHICERCARDFSTENALKNHDAYCKNFDYAKLLFPKNEPFVKFKNYQRMQKNFLKIYADFECYQQKESILRGNKTELITKHIPCAWGIYECRTDGKNKYHDYVGENAEEEFIKKLDEIAKSFYEEFKYGKPIDLRGVKDSDKCWVCNEKFKKNEIPVNDHCHFTGKFRGKAHSECNLLLQRNLKFIPVFLHNLAGYDEKLFIRKLGEKTKIIARNDESFISFSNNVKVDEYTDKNGKLKEKFIEVRFLDSFKFMSGSLDNLAKNLNPEQFLNTNRYFEKPEKGYYPYEYLDSFEKLNETSLPSHENFYSILRGENITEENYELAKKAFKKYKCKTLKDYTKIYMKMDVLLLSDIMENFIETCIKFYKLDPTWYYTIPGFAWDCCLKFTGQALELFTENNGDMLLFFENGIRGGISCITKRYAKANNPYMKEFDKSKPISYILYLDANNLYGWAMSKKLPVGKFRWMEDEELKDWRNEDWGCVLEVDLEYPQELHEKHNDLPLAPERMDGKLIPNLKNKEKYILHREMLKTCLDHGLKLTKIHRGIKFEEKAWLKPYIDFNTEKRAKSKNSFEKDFFKLMNNSVFGKTMENLRNRVNVEMASDYNFRYYTRKVNFERRTILTENKSLVHLRKLSLTMNKPLYVGMCILDISKTLMYNFHYNEVLGKQFPNAELLFTDTDSLCYEIQAEDVYKTMAENVDEWYDTSGYEPMKTLDGKDFPHGRNKKTIGYMKDEENGNIITHFGGVRSKCYSYKTEKKCVKKAKGIKKNIIKKGITFEDYERCIFEKKSLEVEVVGFRSLNHEIHTEKIKKKAMDYTDTKREIQKDGIHTKAWGYK